jgi:cell division inhibitor SepF
MSFWDNVKKFAQPYADEEYDDYEDEDGYAEEEQAPRGRRAAAYTAPEQAAPEYEAPAYAEQPAPAYTNPAPAYSNPAPAYTAPAYSAPAAEQRPTGFSGSVLSMNHNKQEVILFHAKTFDDAAKAADELRNKRAVILNMENIDKALTRRVVDFLSGCIFALDGKVKKVAQATYLFCPHDMEIIGNLEAYAVETAENYI